MRRKCVRFLATLMILTVFSSAICLRTTGTSTARLGVDAYGQLPLSFEPNVGQTDPSVKFLSRAAGYTLFLTQSEAVFAFPESKSRALRMQLRSANLKPIVTAVDELPGKVSFFKGQDTGKWRTNIPTYNKVRYSGVYPGIDLLYYGNAKQLEYDFVVAPGADPGVIRLAFEGNETTRLDEAGDLVLASGDRDIRLHRPVVYQEERGARHEIPAEYALLDDRQVGFTIGPYDRQKPLIVDPILYYSTYLGGNADDSGYGIDVDTLGNAYITGRANSTDFPTMNPLQPSKLGTQDAFVAKLNPAGSLVYSTYLGGGNSDAGNSIAVDGSGNAYVAGVTYSNDFPTAGSPYQNTFGGASDGFVAKLNQAGSALVYSTYLGGTLDDTIWSIALDPTTNAYVTGFTPSTNFPLLNSLQSFGGGYDAFVTKLNTTGSGLVYSTFLGGSDNENGLEIAVDAAGNAYVTGSTTSTNFPTTSPYQLNNGGAADGFVTKINVAGSARAYSTYLGGTGDDESFGIAVDPAGSAYVTGYTASSNFPTLNPVQSFGGDKDVFVTKFTPAGSALVYSTFIGSTGDDRGDSIAVDTAGNAHFVGFTSSSNFPTNGSLQSAGGLFDAFLARLNPAGSALTFSTFLGGSDNDYSQAVALDAAGNDFVAGETKSTNFPTMNPLQPAHGTGGTLDAFIAKIEDKRRRAQVTSQ